MHPTFRLTTLCLSAILCSVCWPQGTMGTLQTNTIPAVKEFGVADTKLVLCFDKTVFGLSRSSASLAHISAKNINYVKVETLKPGLNGGVNAEITGGAIKKPNIVITLTEAVLHTTGATVLFTNQELVVQFGTYDAKFQECFYQKLYSGMISPQSVTFNNPAGKAIKYVIVETDQNIEIGGISASIHSGTVGDSKALTVQVNATPNTIRFFNNFTVRMFCEK
uniref:Uncharacterized protein n=1 Tax=Anopheles christyi TaxID=43041 RepID=A0A182KEZ9_9DIPT